MNTIQGQITTFTIPEKNKQESDVTGVIKIYIYHWPLFLLAVLIFMPLAYFYASKMLPIYEIKASIIIKDGKKTQEPNSSALHEIDLINSSKIIENEIEILKSRKLITQVVKDLNLWVNYQKKDGLKKIDLYDKSPVKLLLVKQDEELDNQKLNIIIKSKDKFDLLMPSGQYKTFSFNKIYKNSFGSWKLVTTENLDKFYGQSLQIGLAGYENLALGYQKLIDASLSNKLSTAVVLTITDQVPQRGKDILNSLIVNYNLETSKDKNKNVENTISFLDQKIASLSGELGRTEKNIEGFKSSRGLTEISLQSKVSLENLQANDAKLNDANVQLDVIKGIDNYVNSASNAEKVPSANGINEPALSNSIDKLSKLQLQYEELAATTPETSPDFEPINRQIKSTKSTIKEIVSNIKQSVTGTRNKLQAYNSRFESSIKNLPAQERLYRPLINWTNMLN
ncbi:GumC family protein [Pedobacter fastidiosus]|uniref:Polysaccharide chain length determinant N-terminal domain-containing protein n=1 Tax=Pedobacter fastidiosus TaxID=2765361 RepID=A0ABR7KVL2_9SPHI|nr:Wzz/FepE/Etk N-terminal domain-containing protein [Pedobacter fastidiosus]MBC6112066.1 hypothetical protein [Pedobacter fastidiosus]